MPDSGRRFLAPTTQGTGDALTAANAAAASTRLTVEAGLRAAGVADPTVKASGTPSDVALEICWRADLGSYSLTSATVYAPTGIHGGISATRKLRHISVDGSGNAIAHSVTRNHSTLTTTATGEANVAMFVGSRTADPRSSIEKDRIINIGTVTRYATTTDRAFVEVAITSGQALKPDGTVFNYGTGAWTLGNTFESASGSYDFVIWDGFKWKQFQYVFTPSNATLNMTDFQALSNFVENIKSFIRNTTQGIALNLVVDGLYARSWSQSLVRQDFGSSTLRNLDVDAQFVVGEPNPSLTQYSAATGELVGGPSIVEDFIAKNCWDAMDTIGSYQQGDGVVGNRPSRNITIRRGVFDTMGDGGVDMKTFSNDPNGYAVYMEDVDIYRAYRSIRFHGGDDIAEGGGLFNKFYIKNVRSFYPRESHLWVSGTSPGIVEWENPGGGVAMTDDASYNAYGVRVDISQIVDHVLITLRDLTVSRNAASPAMTVNDNSSTYPTEAAAAAAGTKRIKIQQVSGAGWTGTITVNGVLYTGATLPITEGDTSRIDVTGAAESILVTPVPANIGDVTVVDANTVDVRWRNTDGSAP